eukprot:845215_1
MNLIILTLLFTIYHSSSLNRRLQPEPTPFPIIGPSGLSCTPQTDDNPPDNCVPPGGQTFIGSPKIECKENFDCCLCKSMICGSNQISCKSLNCNGDSSCLGVQDIILIGTGDAEINCNGDFSCNTVSITGTGIKQVVCNGDYSCAKSRFDLVCNPNAPCAIQCSGDNSCQGTPKPSCQNNIPQTCTVFTISNSAGLSCADDACSNGVFHFENNFGGNILCNGETSCQNAEIIINDIALLICGQAMACKNADITITDPRQDFSLECTAPGSCEGMTLTLIINNPDIEVLKVFRCGAATACKALLVEVIRSSYRDVFIEKLECTGLNACQHAEFVLGPGISFQNCNCGTSTDRSCDGIKGIDTCLTGLDKLECKNEACEDTRELIHNPAFNFKLICGDVRACEQFYLTLNFDDLRAMPVSLITGYACSNYQSCKDAVIVLNNQQQYDWINIALIECTGKYSCLNTQFISNGNVEINNILCANSDACQGCTNTINGECVNCDGNGDTYCSQTKRKK